jgi:hypothetical protein
MKRRNPTTRRLEVYYLDGNPEYRQMLGNPMLASYINEPGPGEHPNCYDIGSHIVLDERVQPGEEALVSYGPATTYARDYPVNENWISNKRLGSHQRRRLERRM